MVKLFGVFIFSCFGLFVAGQKSSKLIHDFDNKFTMLIPSDVDTMSAGQIKEKYHKTKDGKTSFYANADMSFSIVLNVLANNIKEEDMVKRKDRLTNELEANGYVLDQNELQKVNNHRLIVVSFYSDVPDGKILNKRFFAVVNNKLVMISFNSTEAELAIRKLQIEESIKSVIIK
jgi:hypothetical protein